MKLMKKSMSLRKSNEIKEKSSPFCRQNKPQNESSLDSLIGDIVSME